MPSQRHGVVPNSDYGLLLDLLNCHSTPGDEGEVRIQLCRRLLDLGWSVSHHGAYALSAVLPRNAGKKRLLVCAHMDSPGYTVESVDGRDCKLVKLGSPRMPLNEADAVLKTGSALVPVRLFQGEDSAGRETFFCHCDTPVRHGDRACFSASRRRIADGVVESPFLDNRIGCYMLCRLAEHLASGDYAYDVVLGATSCEEVGCIGAPVLAAAVQPDYVICLDATYENPEQHVQLGGGPVITLSDASVILSCDVRDRLLSFFAAQKIPVQTEVYNYSSTDARAFPMVGLPCPVLALLIASRGNHSPAESIAADDIELLADALIALTHCSDLDRVMANAP